MRRLAGGLDRAVAWLLSALTALASRGSIDRALAVGAGFGRVWVRLGLPRTRRAREQLAEAFAESSAAQHEAWTRGVFEHYGQSLAELILLRSRHRAALLERVAVEGLEHLEAAQRASSTGGVLVVTAHYGNWELAGARIASLGIPIAAVYRGLESPALERALLEIRHAEGFAQVDYQQIRMGKAGLSLLRALKKGRKVFVLLDQNARREEGVFVSFFGRPAAVRSGPIQIAARHGIPILPAFIRRDPASLHHRIQIQPPWTLDPESDPRSDPGIEDERERQILQRLTGVIEAQIREEPAQWIWTHRRWRTRPEDPPPPWDPSS